MKRVICLTLIALCLANSALAQGAIDIAVKKGTKGEQQTREQLQRLMKSYDLSRWTFTRSIIIEEGAIPHSHPVLTLSTRHVRDDELLLSTFVHEQAHWFLTQNDKATQEAKKELRVTFPKAPVSFPEGASDEESTYLHLIVIYLEYRADRELLGELKARQVMDFWATDHYTWIYKTVLEHAREIGNLALKHKLIPGIRG
ncbi:MAG TPA: hypothetical protein VN937_22590 [Blastocatellia bacterium]|nr:hypothetical protein [Blastocatellia bacterium]